MTTTATPTTRATMSAKPTPVNAHARAHTSSATRSASTNVPCENHLIVVRGLLPRIAHLYDGLEWSGDTLGHKNARSKSISIYGLSTKMDLYAPPQYVGLGLGTGPGESSCHDSSLKAGMQDAANGLPRTPLLGTWVNRRYDARSVDDPGYTDTVREDFDRIADLSEAEGWDRRVVMGPRRPGCR